MDDAITVVQARLQRRKIMRMMMRANEVFPLIHELKEPYMKILDFSVCACIITLHMCFFFPCQIKLLKRCNMSSIFVTKLSSRKTPTIFSFLSLVHCSTFHHGKMCKGHFTGHENHHRYLLATHEACASEIHVYTVLPPTKAKILPSLSKAMHAAVASNRD